MAAQIPPANEYWDGYYATGGRKGIDNPSQFAAFVIGEIDPGEVIVDVGCGNGRDAMFFAHQGIDTVGVDASSSAIQKAAEQASANNLSNVTFLNSAVEDPDLPSRIIRSIADSRSRITLYARFFLHAITADQEVAFLKLAAEVCGNQGRLMCEFRTFRDAGNEKVTPNHYRRYLVPHEFSLSAFQAGFLTTYFVEGFGFAKYKNDDAYVARFILTRVDACCT